MRRNDAFTEVYRRLLGKREGRGTYKEMRELVEEALNQRPLHYYVSLSRAKDIWRLYKHHGVNPRPGLWTEFCQDVEEELEARPWLGEDKALSFVVCFKRPSRYWLAPTTAWRIILARMDKMLTFAEVRV